MGNCCCTERGLEPTKTIQDGKEQNGKKDHSRTMSVEGRGSRRLPRPLLKRQRSLTRLIINYIEVPIAVRSRPEKTAAELQQITASLERHLLFQEMPENELKEVIFNMEKVVVDPEQEIYREGRKPQHYFVLTEGQVEEQPEKFTLNAGEDVGEVSFVTDSNRERSVFARTRVTLWAIHKSRLSQLRLRIIDSRKSAAKTVISSLKPFRCLSEECIDLLAAVAELKEYEANAVIVPAGTVMDRWIWVKSGGVKKTMDGTTEALGSNHLFECKQLPTKAAYTAITPVIVWFITRKAAEAVLGCSFERARHDCLVKSVLQGCPHLSFLSAFQQTRLMSTIFVQKYAKNEEIFGRKPFERCIVVTFKGKLTTKSGQSLPKCIGADPLTWVQPMNWAEDMIAAEEPTWIALISTNLFTKLPSGEIEYVDEKWKTLEKLKKATILQRLSDEKIEAILKASSVESFTNGVAVYSKGSQSLNFYIIVSGFAEVSLSQTVIKVKGPLDYFGDRALIYGGRYATKVTALRNLECWVIPKKVINKYLNDRSLSCMKDRIIQQESPYIQLDDLIVVRYVRQEYEFLCLVVNPSNSELYNLRMIPKDEIRTSSMKNNEWEIGDKLFHPFITPYFIRLQSEDFYYYFNAYIPGCTLQAILDSRRNSCLKEREIRFYLACIVLVLDYLHENEIAYRNLRPDAILVDLEGYPQLHDFKRSKAVIEKTYTIASAPHYVSPEMIRRTGYRFESDYWSLGVLLYRCAYGTLPFGNDLTSPYDIYEEILKGELEFPKTEEEDLTQCRPIIESLLSCNPALRMTAARMKKNPYFRGMEWV